jgi:anti-sigma-K factor RskA
LSSIESAGATFPEAPPRREGSRRRRLFAPGGLAAAAAILAVIGLFVWNASLRNANEDLRGEVETHQTYELQGSGPAENVRGQVVEIGDDRGVLVAENLPSTPEGEVYETWLMRGVPEPAGLFQPKNEGDAATPIEGSLEDADAVAVTVEPSGGSSAPTSEILLTATL